MGADETFLRSLSQLALLVSWPFLPLAREGPVAAAFINSTARITFNNAKKDKLAKQFC